MKINQLKIANTVSLLWRTGINKSRISAAVTLLVVGFIASIAADTSTVQPDIPVVRETKIENKATPVPTGTEKFFGFIVGIFLPFSILGLLFYLQYSPGQQPGKISYLNKTS